MMRFDLPAFTDAFCKRAFCESIDVRVVGAVGTMKFGIIITVFLAISLGLSPSTVFADAEDDELDKALDAVPDIENGKRLFKICSSCHTTEAWGTPDGKYPQLSGQHTTVLLKQLTDIRLGNRDNPEMLPFAQLEVVGGPQGVADVVAYISRLPMNPHPGSGSGKTVKYGRELYESKCARCHGDNGEGDAESFFPRLQGQHYVYLLRQLKWIRDGKRRNVFRGMSRRLKGLTDDDFEAIADYIARLLPPKELLGPHGWKNPDFWQRIDL